MRRNLSSRAGLRFCCLLLCRVFVWWEQIRRFFGVRSYYFGTGVVVCLFLSGVIVAVGAS
jgi:uncharacterized membrane protein SpoIIM required for sporulation